SGGVIVLPDQPGAHPHLMVAAGKEGKLYLINRDDMGKYQRCGATCDGVVQTVDLSSGIFGTPAYFNGRVYYHGAGDVVKAFQLTNGLLSTTPVSQTTTGWGFPGSSPSVSANGTTNGILSSGTLGNPTNLTATAVSTSQINLAWTAATGAVTGYRVERCQGAGCTNFALLATGVAGTTYNDIGLTAATSYSYRVQANDA